MIQRRECSNYEVNVKLRDIGLYIFDYISSQYSYDFPVPGTPTAQLFTKGLVIDNMLARIHGEKNASPFLMRWFENKNNYDEDLHLSPAALGFIGDMVYSLYKDKWDKLISLLNEEYDPIHNYLDEWQDESDRDKTGSNSFTSTRQDTLNTTETTQSTRTDNLLSTKTINESESTTDTQTDGIFGFNSSTSSNADKSDGSSSKTTIGTDTDANTGTQGLSQTVADTGTNTRGTQEAGSETENEDIARSGRHSGNIGNITTQKMIKEEIELRQWNIIYQMINDVIDLVALPVYLNSWELPEPGTYVPSN